MAEGVNAVTAASAVLSVDERVVASRSLKPLSKPVPARGGKFDVRVFTTRLLALLDAGLNVTESLEALSARAANSGSEVIARLLRSVREGSGFSRALEREYAEFPTLLVATVKAAERTGSLSQSLHRYVAYDHQLQDLRRRLTAAAIYPAILLIVGTLVGAFLLGYVVPKFAVVYDASNREVPWLSALMLRAGRALHDNAAEAALTASLALGVIVLTLLSAAGRSLLVGKLIRLPGIARLGGTFRRVRLYRATALQLDAGISLPRALNLSSTLLSRDEQASLAQARMRIEQGVVPSVALAHAGLADSVDESLLRAGERSGRLAQMLDSAAEFQEGELRTLVDWTSRVIEPALMVAIGLAVGTVIVLLYIPIFDLASGLA